MDRCRCRNPDRTQKLRSRKLLTLDRSMTFTVFEAVRDVVAVEGS